MYLDKLSLFLWISLCCNWGVSAAEADMSPSTPKNATWFSSLSMHVQSLLFLSQNFSNASSPVLDCSPEALAELLPSHATLSYAVPVSSNGTWFKPSPPFPAPNTGLPELCAVAINVVSSPTSSYNFGLFLPKEWNSRFLASGNGGLGGGINWNDMGTGALSGFVGMSTDTGHLSSPFDGSWALNNPETQTDWGYRAMHGSVELGKLITEKYYGSRIKYSYYSACSTGGRQGLKEIQMFPEDFDGVVVGAPAWWTSRLQPWSLEIGLWNLPLDAPTHIPSSLFPVIAKEVMRQCDPQDGLIDGIIQEPSSCEFIMETLLCTPSSNTSTCLTAPQLKTLYRIYHDWSGTNNTFLFPHYPLGSEAEYPFLLGTDSGSPNPLGTSWISNMVLNITGEGYDWFTGYNISTVFLGDELNPGHASANDFDMSPFAKRGGKLIHYHGYSDGFIPAESSIYFHKQVLATLIPKGIPVPEFYKFYLVPGMQHCYRSVGDAPWHIGGGSQAYTLGDKVHGVPGFEDARHDVLKAVMRWVEEGIAPKELVATKYVDDDVTLGVKRQRKLCPYPEKARFSGIGDPDKECSWRCEKLF